VTTLSVVINYTLAGPATNIHKIYIELGRSSNQFDQQKNCSLTLGFVFLFSPTPFSGFYDLLLHRDAIHLHRVTNANECEPKITRQSLISAWSLINILVSGYCVNQTPAHNRHKLSPVDPILSNLNLKPKASRMKTITGWICGLLLKRKNIVLNLDLSGK